MPSPVIRPSPWLNVLWPFIKLSNSTELYSTSQVILYTVLFHRNWGSVWTHFCSLRYKQHLYPLKSANMILKVQLNARLVSESHWIHFGKELELQMSTHDGSLVCKNDRAGSHSPNQTYSTWLKFSTWSRTKLLGIVNKWGCFAFSALSLTLTIHDFSDSPGTCRSCSFPSRST